MLSEQRRDFRGSFSGYERDRFFHNPTTPGAPFVPAAYVLGLDDDHDGRAAAPVDIDGDGDLDLALLTLQGLRLLENVADDRPTHFARVRVVTASAGPAIGASLEVVADDMTHRRRVGLTEGFQTQRPGDLHIGLGRATRIDRLDVVWPSGARQTWVDLPVDQLLIVEAGAADVEVQPLARWADSMRPSPVGAPSTAIEAPELDGGRGRLSAGGRPAVINFWAPWCAPCNVELPQLVKLADAYADEVDFVGVSVEREDLQSVGDTLQTFDIGYPQYLADDNVMSRFFGAAEAAALPSTFVFDGQDRLRRVFRGAVTETELDALLTSLRDEGIFAADLEVAARALMRAADYERAIGHYRRLSELRPASAEPLYQIGVAALELERVGEAQEAFEEAVNRAPTNALARLGLGLAQLRNRQPGPGFANLQSALQGAEGSPVILRAIAAAASAAGQLWLAAEALEQAVELEPGSVATWLDLGHIYLARGEGQRARGAFERALALAPGDPAARAAVEQLGSP